MALNFNNFMVHTSKFKYLSNTNSVSLGNGYSYTSKPVSPKLKQFTLTFRGFRYYFTSNTSNELDYETNKTLNNLGTLCQFFEEVGTYTTFLYKHSQFGEIKVRFSEELSVPDPVGNRGFVQDFNVVLTEVTT